MTAKTLAAHSRRGLMTFLYCAHTHTHNHTHTHTAITVTFSEDSYTFPESGNITLTIVLQPESANNVVVNLDSNGRKY